MPNLASTHHELDDLGGGQFRHVQHLRAIGYRKDGSLRQITNTIGSTGDPGRPIGVDELVQWRVARKLAGQSPILHFGKGADHVRLTALGTNTGVNAVVAGNTVTYPEAWDNADLRFAIGGHILRKEVQLKAGHPASFAFRIDKAQGFDTDTLAGAEFRMLDPVLVGPTPTDHIPLAWVKTTSGGKRILTATLPAGDYAGWTLDPTITLQPDVTDGTDCYIDSNAADTNNSGGGVQCGEYNAGTSTRRGLISFSLVSLPAAAIISTSTLTLTSQYDYTDNDRTLSVYRQKRAWVEAQATWNIWKTGSVWATAGGFGAADCEQTAIGSGAQPAAVGTGGTVVLTLTPTTKAGLDLGSGWLLRVDTETDDLVCYYNCGDTPAFRRPTLAITYTLPVSGGLPLLHLKHWGRR